ncbi:TerC/Alx family metal homeostasis membrane protein [Archangium primigenium]|uniref:TerC/Alx family metal homeostasis membrane protein n=1 Tax=[Archangium] primigenium TaxID=2792470 RepID=UPI001956334E|nr:TerC/Alx family metal homeostasis membrane protein [Archangium primigenium]MBM7113003.1 TerC/Alx family metal homeostasis membrane protein [Archangium primigenium]
MSANSVSPWEWGLFGVIVVAMLLVDLLAHRKTQHESRKRAYAWSAAWIGVGLAFAGFVAVRHGGTAAQEYLGAYLIEKSLSLDNLFVFLVIFSSLNVPEDSQRRVLFWGILGALGFRALFIFLGLQALERWHWVVYVFAALLLVAAVRVARSPPNKPSEGKNKLVGFLEKHLPVTREFDGKRFFVREDGHWRATPLLLALITIELSDVAFAIDSVPAAMSVSRNMFVVYTSNILAILGLRALYIALAKTVHALRYLHWGLAAVLAFAAAKMLLSHWVEVPPLLSVAIIVVLIGASVAWSLRYKARHPQAPASQRSEPRPPAPGGRREARA